MPAKTYDSSLTDAKWETLQAIWPVRSSRGAPPTWPRRLILDAIFYVLCGGIAWRAPLQKFPPWQTVFCHARQMRLSAIWKQINSTLRKQYSVGVRN
ncbi:MAG: transposase, partial [Deinococcus sp.]